MSDKTTPQGYNAEFGDTLFSVPNALSTLQSPTPRNLIKQKTQGGTSLDYVSASTVIRTLNKAFGMRWSFRIHETRMVPSVPHHNNEQKPVAQTLGELTIPGLGSRMQWGSQSVVGSQQQQEHAFKGSASDALKKCAAMFLVHLDLADGGPQPGQFVGPEDLPKRDLMDLMQKQESMENEVNEAEEATTRLKEAAQEITNESNVTNPAENIVNQAVNPEMNTDTPTEEPEIPEAVQESLQTVPSGNKSEQPVNEPNYETTPKENRWSPEDVQGLKDHKERLGIKTNEALNPYIQQFFGNDQMTYRHLTPTTIKDFNHFLSGR